MNRIVVFIGIGKVQTGYIFACKRLVPQHCQGKSARGIAGVECIPVNFKSAVGKLLQGEISPITDRWGDAEYKRLVCANLLNEILSFPEMMK